MEYPITLFKHGESKEIKNAGEEARAREQGFTEPYKYQEYPKALYRNGERVHVSADSVEKLHDGGCRVVKSKDEEDAARADGYRMLHEPAPEKKDDAQGSQDDAGGEDGAKGKAKGKNGK
jgi:hypothetical protein